MTVLTSMVFIVADQYKEAANATAEYYGYGPENISVQLVDVDNNIFWGAHAYENVFTQAAPEEEVPGSAIAIAAIYKRFVEGGDPLENWNAALAELGLSRVE